MKQIEATIGLCRVFSNEKNPYSRVEKSLTLQN